MAHEIEIASIDLRYEGYRLKNPAAEERLLVSIRERGIEEPLEGVTAPDVTLLLNGFKRYRCAKKLGIGVLPYVSLGADDATGILALMRASTNRALSILEEARFIDDLRERHQMSVADIGQTLGRSKGWVGMRLGLIGGMSERVRMKLFSGAFPVYSYMYTVRQFMRMNGVRSQEADEFVEAVSGRKLSIREIEQLAQGYFRGPDSLRAEIRSGHLALVLDRLRPVPEGAEGCTAFERTVLNELEWVQRGMLRVMGKGSDQRLKTPAFCAQANLVSAGILNRIDAFTRTLRQIHDRTGTA